MTDTDKTAISKSKVEEVFSEFKVFFRNEVSQVDAVVQSAKYSAPESYISDMKGYSRGLSHMGHKALQFFREKLK
jgi:hypothetical protein